MTHTKGNVIVENIKIGDIHYEFDYGLCIRVKVISPPVRDDDGYWTWESQHLDSDRVIKYGVNEKYPHYAPNLYDYIAYSGCTFI
jgi:hypothetical protein